MQIDNHDQLMKWLVKSLAPLCEADPIALAKYVFALVKRDRTEDDLRKQCEKDLDVFLKEKTGKFVDSLLDAIKNKRYLGPSDLEVDPRVEARIDPRTDPRVEPRKPEEKPGDNQPKDRGERHRSPLRRRSTSRDRRENRDTRRRHDDKTRRDRGGRRYERGGRDRRSRSRSRSRSPYNRRHRHERSPSNGSKNDATPTHDEQVPDDALPPKPPMEKKNESNQKPRCKDFDEKGYCVRGDFCPYDHGSDPVVVDDPFTSGLPFNRMPGIPPNGPGGGNPMPPHMMMRPTRPANLPAPQMLPPGVPPMYWPMPRMGGPRPPMAEPPRERQLVSIVTHSEGKGRKGPGPPSLGSFHVPRPDDGGKREPPHRRYGPNPRMGNNSGPPMHMHMQLQMHQPMHQPMLHASHSHEGGNTTLEIRKIPATLNNVTKLSEHFSRFGNVVNLQVGHEGDPEAALVSFTNHGEAAAAHRSPEPLFNNRFIKVFWHKNLKPQQQQQQQQQQQPGEKEQMNDSRKRPVKERLGPLPTSDQLKLNNMKPPAPALGEPAEKKVLFSPTDGTLTRTVFTASKGQPLAERQVKTKPASRKAEKKEVLKKELEIRKRKQKMLEEYIQNQKTLISKASSAKTVEEKEKILQTTREIITIIEKLKEDLSKQSAVLQANQSEKAGGDGANEEPEALRKRVQLLRREAFALVRGRARGFAKHPYMKRRRSSVDAETANVTQLLIKGFDAEDKDEVVAHFAQFGDIRDLRVKDELNQIILDFASRAEALNAARYGQLFKGKSLYMAWFKEPIASDNQALDEAADNAVEADDLDEEVVLPPEEEEEEEEDKPRSWRI